MLSYTSERQRWILIVSVPLLLTVPIGNAIISETADGYTFTAPDPPDTTLLARNGAQEWCLGNNSILAEIYNSQIQQAIVSFINRNSQIGLGKRNIWINGMRTPLSSWTWVNGKNASRFSSLPQSDNERVNGYLQNNQNGRSISADLPTVTRGYICEGVDSLCNGGFQYNSRCYRAFSTPALSWYDARNECKKSSEGDIASFDFINDNQSLRSFNWSWIDSFNPYWIGIRSRWWTWQSSKSEIIYTNWGSGHPTASYDCLQLFLEAGSQWKWGACGCNEMNQLICLRDTTSTSAAVTPAVSYGMTPAHSKGTPNSGMTTSNSSREVNSMPSSSGSKSLAVPLGVGLGVGIGGLLIVIAVIVVVVLLIKRHRQKRPQTQDTLVNPENTYAKVLGNSGSEMDANEANVEANKIVYSTVHAENP